MAEKKRAERSEKASMEFDISSPYEDYSNMLKNFNSDSDLMQIQSPSSAPDLVQNLIFSGYHDHDRDHTVNKHFVNLQQSTDENSSCTSGTKLLAAGPPEPLDCRKCDVMREIMHTNGELLTVLSIHGQTSVFYHATLDVYHYAEGFSYASEQSYVDLKHRDLDWIKQFLIDYGVLRKKENYNVIKDFCMPFYDALCAGANLNNKPKEAPGNCEIENENAISSLAQREFGGSSSNIEAKTESINQNSSNSDSITNNQTENVIDKVEEQRYMMNTNKISTGSHEKAKIHIKEQRKRTAEMQLREIAQYFHLPLMEAAKELQVCTSSLKAICCKHGITRWPQRKIRAMDNRIASLKRELKSQNSGSKVANWIKREIKWLEEKKATVYSGTKSTLIKDLQNNAGEGSN